MNIDSAANRGHSLSARVITTSLYRRTLLAGLISAMASLLPSLTLLADDQQRPNFVVIFADDLGYGDLSCYGHPTIHTPHLDQMAAEGMRFTQFYTAASVCTPSRAGLLTGRLPVRNGLCSDNPRVFTVRAASGIPAEEITLAEALADRGYVSGCFGKWHLGHLPEFLPTHHGFSTYFGLPYSNDMGRIASVGPKGRGAFLEPKSEYWDSPLIRDLEVIERPVDQTTLTKRYTQAAVQFIRDNAAKPFFVYLPHNLPHVPLFRSPEFEGHSQRGLYGDVVEEVDWSVGQVLQTLRELQLDQKTYVFFTSDNGPWLIFDQHGGSAGLLKDGKGCTWEGGMRVPGIAWAPGRIAPGQTCRELAATLDLFPTCVSLAGGKVPSDRIMDGFDLSPLLHGKSQSPRDTVFFYRGQTLMALRHGPWKAHFFTQPAYGEGSNKRTPHEPPLLYNLHVDPSERHDVAAAHADVLDQIRTIAEEHKAKLTIPPSRLEILAPE